MGQLALCSQVLFLGGAGAVEGSGALPLALFHRIRAPRGIGADEAQGGCHKRGARWGLAHRHGGL